MSRLENILRWIKISFGVISSVLTYLFGGADMLLKALIFCIIADYITGIMSAVYLRKLNSHTGYKGILKKIAILVTVALGHIIGMLVGQESVREIVIGFYIANEGISILENVGRMDVKYLDKLKDILEQLKK